MIPGIKIDLSGTAYTVPPLSLGSLEVLQERLTAFRGSLADAPLVIDALHQALLRNYPDLTRAEVASKVGLESFTDVFEAVMDVSGMKRKALEAAAAAAEEAPSQGEA